MAGTHVRWGIDPDHRQAFGVPTSIEGNTWQAALDQLLTGAAVDEGDMTLAVGDVSPYGVEGQAAGTVGRLAEAIGCLRAAGGRDLLAQADRGLGGGTAPGR